MLLHSRSFRVSEQTEDAIVTLANVLTYLLQS